ncbi:hypothetical protein K0U00_30940, partial [Paenibacillus sepulcri]|nr:hypothetical protein [Paenibacillus sepulcri]
MAEPLKDMYHEQFLRQFGEKVHAVYKAFNTEAFVAAVMEDGWYDLKLKERIRRISTVLGTYLPPRYEDALDVLYAIDAACVGFPYLFFTDIVEVYGQSEEHWGLSMDALERFTSKSS